MEGLDTEQVMRAAAHGILVAWAFIWSGRFLWSLFYAVDWRETPMQTAMVAGALWTFGLSGWWLFGPIVRGLL